MKAGDSVRIINAECSMRGRVGQLIEIYGGQHTLPYFVEFPGETEPWCFAAQELEKA